MTGKIDNGREIIAKYLSGGGQEIFLTKERKRHLLAHPDVLEFLEEASSKVHVPDGDKYFREAVNLGRNIGISLLVKTDLITPDKETDFALRVERQLPVRIALNSQGESCDSVTLEIMFDDQSKKYFLNTAYVGYPCPMSPYHVQDRGSKEYKEALDFWCSHALAYDPKIMKEPFRDSWNSVLEKIKK